MARVLATRKSHSKLCLWYTFADSNYWLFR